jgi:uncharacterized membrane protein HdeD (DUF308 family)
MAAFSAVRTMSEHWWVVLLRGILAILFGVLAFAWPGLTALILVTIWGVYALFDGVFGIIAGIKGKWTSLVLLGVLSIAAGLVAILRPGLAAISLLWVLAIWIIVAGSMQIAAAIRLRKEVQGEWMWIASGLLMVVLGLLFFFRPGEGILSVTWLIATLAVVWGVLLVMLSFKLKGLKGRMVPQPA